MLGQKHPEALFVSAATGENADELVGAVVRRVQGPQVSVTLEADSGNGRLMQYLSRHARLSGQRYEGGQVRLRARLGRKHLAALAGFGADVKILSSAEP